MNGVNPMTPILAYPIASGPMCYAVVSERTVYLQGDLGAGFRLCGQIPGGSEASSVNLTQMLLEFAMTWNMAEDAGEARRQMQMFGRRLGKALADQRALTTPVNGVLGRAADALEDVFRSLDASFARCQTESELRYQLDPCPLHVTAQVTTMEGEAELAHYALNAICQSVVEALAPELRIQLPGGPNVEQVISVVALTGHRVSNFG